MIFIDAVSPTGMFSFGLIPIIRLDGQGSIFLRGMNEDNGGSNGSGKSSLLNAIKEILFGKNDSGKSGPNVVNKHEDWDNGMFGAVWLRDHQGHSWRIFSIRKWKGDTPDFVLQNGNSQVLMSGQSYTGQDVFVEWWDGNCWIDARPTARKDNKSMTDAQAMISDQVLGMSYEQFSAYVCLGQKAESALVSGTSGAREKVIQAVADVSIWSKAAELVKDTYTNKLSEQNMLEYQISGMRSALDTIYIPSDEEIQSAKDAVQATKIEENRLREKLNELQQQLTETHQNRSALKADGIDQEIELLEAEKRHSEDRYKNAIIFEKDSTLSNLEEELGRMRYDHMTSVSKLQDYQELNEGECDNCGQMVTGGHLEKQKIDLQSRIDSISSHMTRVQQNIKDKQNEVEKIQNEVEAKAADEFNKEMASWQKAMNDLLERKRQYGVIGVTIDGLNQQYQQIEQQIALQPNNIAAAEANLNSLLSRVSERQQIETNIKTLENQHANIVLEIEHLRWTERNLKKLRVQEYESAIDRLNQLLADRLWELWGAGLQARFVTATSTTRGSRVKSGLEFLVDTPKKKGVPIELYSGGETKIIVVAMFLAMIELAVERGSGVNLAAIDEIDEHLDDFRTDRLVDAIEAVIARVSTCLIISHNARLLNTMNFDQTWIVRKKDEFSTIEFGRTNQLAA